MTVQNFPYLENLNPQQHEAAETLQGPVLVLAGAGTGKTKTLTARLAHVLATGQAAPGEVLAVTFTNKAAAEMKRRVFSLLNVAEGMNEGWWLGTFHALAARMLRRCAALVGLTSHFTIFDEDDQLRLIKGLLEERNIDTKRTPPRLALSVIQGWKDKGLTPAAVPASEKMALAEGRLPDLYDIYQQRLRILNACDFGDLLLHILTVFRSAEGAEILNGYRRRFKYILVDEYQDTNDAQHQWLRLLSEGRHNICCVGDDDQSIYGWRGADIGHILRFEKDYPGARVIRLEQNYRSTGHILAAANGVIAQNRGRLGKNLWSAAGDGEKVTVQGVWDGLQEAAEAARTIESWRAGGMSFSEMAVLVRAAHQTRAFEESFLRHGIPHKVLSGLRFYERQEIRDAIAYLRVIAQGDDDMAFLRIINVPRRGIGDATIAKIQTAARALGVSMHAALDTLLRDGAFGGKTGAALEKLMAQFARWRALMQDVSQVDLARLVLDESGYLDMWRADKSPEATGRLENLKEFAGALAEFNDLDAFLEHIALVMDTNADASGDQVSIMTYHAAKGLEFDGVLLPGWEEGLFPNARALDESGLSGLEEERRLAYVGLTRARRRAKILFAANRLIYGGWTTALPSRFIEELPREHVDIKGGASAPPMARENTYGGSFRGRAAALVTPAFSAESADGFCVGERVTHDTFGAGTVTAADHNRLTIRFDRGGTKTIIDRFVQKAAGE